MTALLKSGTVFTGHPFEISSTAMILHCPGWLVLVARRHIHSVEELTENEAVELERLIRRTSIAFKEVTGCSKSLRCSVCRKSGASTRAFPYIPNMIGQLENRTATRVFEYLGVTEEKRGRRAPFP